MRARVGCFEFEELRGIYVTPDLAEEILADVLARWRARALPVDSWLVRRSGVHDSRSLDFRPATGSPPTFPTCRADRNLLIRQ